MLEKFRERFSRKPKVKKKRGRPRKNSLPQEWGKNPSPKTSEKVDVFSRLKYGKSNKIRIPGLKLVNQAILAVMLVINFFISQAALTGGRQSQAMFFIFIFNSYGLLYGLWKSRKEPLKIEG